MPHRGIKPASAACRSNALPMSYMPSPHFRGLFQQQADRETGALTWLLPGSLRVSDCMSREGIGSSPSGPLTIDKRGGKCHSIWLPCQTNCLLVLLASQSGTNGNSEVYELMNCAVV